ncbi:DUF3289 family protein [Pantoea dispersa]|uniref:DUF3289 family protein n=1 Tax=Pantoea dispersa TaxID=59814 RepID=UPI0021F717E3|nr:DUF3289 family protein [Pantoea dispersa]MCW0319659.1 hypothetical protein [Pantoea dispersa]MCW0324395.1 hypothetical protein [Pantoea dispersa]MCW0431878.1 hypothetical protein [Pantoea dispersa]
MSNAVFPATVFTTQRRFNDYSSDDMRYGDIPEERLKREFGLVNISNVVDPYTLTRLTAFDTPQSRFAGAYNGIHRGGKLSVEQCAQLLFEEMQVTSLPYSFIGPHRYLINQMLRHFQLSRGSAFYNAQLNLAYRDKLHSDYDARKTTSIMRETIGLFIDYNSMGFPQEKLEQLTSAIKLSILPKFDSMLLDKINGMGITVHDVHATKIEIIRLNVNNTGWYASIKFSGQDHFGLDARDIGKQKFSQFQFFKIWFVLQHFDRFGFRPFLTNMEAVIDIEGKR